jgi:hypothetical protein
LEGQHVIRASVYATGSYLITRKLGILILMTGKGNFRCIQVSYV